MRLIDANELKPDYLVYNTVTGVPFYRYYSTFQIENAHTIEAIPVEWIAEWRWENSDVCCDKRVASLFKKMIEDWREEND